MSIFNEFEIHLEADIISGTCVIIAIFLSAVLIGAHLRNYTNPKEQKHIVRILFMVPIYCIDSYLSLVFKGWGKYLDLVRDSYESFVIFSFMKLCIAYAGGEAKLVQSLTSKKRAMSHLWPLKYFLEPFQPGLSFLVWCKRGTLAFVMLNPIIAVLTLVLESQGYYQEGKFSLADAYPYVAFIDNIGVSLAMYSLVLFYMATEDILKQFNPLGKFLCVKSVIFFSFWQSVAVAALVKINYIADFGSWTADDIGSGLQEFLICIEMMFASLLHIAVFSYKPYEALPVIATIESGPIVGVSANSAPLRQKIPTNSSIRSKSPPTDGPRKRVWFSRSVSDDLATAKSGDSAADVSARQPLLSDDHNQDDGEEDMDNESGAGAGSSGVPLRRGIASAEQSGYDNLWHALNVTDVVHDTKKTFLVSVDDHLAGDATDSSSQQTNGSGSQQLRDEENPYLSYASH